MNKHQVSLEFLVLDKILQAFFKGKTITLLEAVEAVQAEQQPFITKPKK